MGSFSFLFILVILTCYNYVPMDNSKMSKWLSDYGCSKVWNCRPCHFLIGWTIFQNSGFLISLQDKFYFQEIYSCLALSLNSTNKTFWSNYTLFLFKYPCATNAALPLRLLKPRHRSSFNLCASPLLEWNVCRIIYSFWVLHTWQ